MLISDRLADEGAIPNDPNKVTKFSILAIVQLKYMGKRNGVPLRALGGKGSPRSVRTDTKPAFHF